MEDDIATNFELKPVVVGFIIAIILLGFGLLMNNAIVEFFGLTLGSAVSGFLSNNSTKYALIYGAIIGFVCSFFMMSVFSIPVFILFGLFGAFIGKVVQSNVG